jgi:hypothetical protein
MSNPQTAEIIALPTTQGPRLLDFENAEVRPGFINDTWFLIVSGVAPCANMEVSLVPLVYVSQPEYWGIEVIGTLPSGICLRAVKPYMVTLDISNVLGTRGIEVMGARRSEQIEVPPRGDGRYDR